MKVQYFIGMAAALQMTMLSATQASAEIITFDGGTATLSGSGGTVITDNNSLYDGVVSYEEGDMLVEFNGDIGGWNGSHIGNYYGNPDAVIHIHWGPTDSVTFSKKDGSSFGLYYIDVTSNTVNGGWSADGTEESWLTAEDDQGNTRSLKVPSVDWGTTNPAVHFEITDPFFENIVSFTITSENAYCFGMDNFYIDEIPGGTPVSLASGQVTHDKTDEGNDAVVVKMEDMPELAAVVKDADIPFDMTFRLEATDGSCIAYEDTVTVYDDNISSKYLKYHEESAEAETKITCSLNNSRCKIGVYDTDIDETCTSEEMTVTLEIAETSYTNTGTWEQNENSTLEHYYYTEPAAD